jgi:hypothetical protein
MSDDILDDFLKNLRETGETSFVPGPLDRGLSSQNPDLSLNLNVERVADRAKQGFTDAKGRAREIGGKVYLNPDRTAYVPYYKDATDALLNPTAMNAAGNNAPYYGAVAATALVTGGLGAAALEGGAGIAGMGALGTSAMHIGGFLGGSAVGGYGAVKGLGAMGFEGPTQYEQLTQAGPLALTQTGIGLATFRPGLPGSMELFKKQALGGAMFAGGVGIEEAGRAAIGKATGTDERPASKIIAEGALHVGEAFLFGVGMKPTALGGGLIQGGRNMANAGNVLPSMIASSQFGGGLFRGGPSPLDIRGRIIPAREPGIVVNEDLTESFDPGSPARRVGDAPYVQQNTRGRGGVVIQNGVPVAGEMVPTTPSEPGQAGLSTQTQNSTFRPSKTGRGDMTSFDPATGAGLKIEVLPNGDVQYTLFTNLGGSALKAKGPYKDLPDQFRVGQHDMIRANFDARVAASEAARKEAVERAKAAGEKTQADIPPVPATEAPPAPSAPVPPAPAAPPVAPVVPKAAPAAPPVSAAMAAVQARHDAAQEAERAAGQALTAAAQEYAEAARLEAEDRNPTTTERRRLASKAEGEALISLEKAQMEAEAASKGLAAAKQTEADNNASSSTPVTQGDKVNPRPLWSKDNGKSAMEWDSEHGDTHNPETGVKYSEEEAKQVKLKKKASLQLFNEEQDWLKIDPSTALDLTSKDNSLYLGKKKVIPRAMLTTEAARLMWDENYGDKYNVNGEPKAKRNDGPMPAPAESSVEPTAPAGETALEAETGNIIPIDSTKPKQELPMPKDEQSLREYEEEMRNPNLTDAVGEDGKPISISLLSVEQANKLYKKYVKKLSTSFSKGNDGEYLFHANYQRHLANARKLKAHIDKLESGEVSVSESTIPKSATGETVPPVATAPMAPATREELLAGTRPLKEASRSTEAGLTTEERKRYIEARKRFLETGESSMPEGTNPASEASEKTSKVPAIPDPEGRKGVIVQGEVVANSDGIVYPSEKPNTTPLTLESPGGRSSESWPAYKLALEQEGSKNVHIIRLPGTRVGKYDMDITGMVLIKFKKGNNGGVIPVLTPYVSQSTYKREHILNGVTTIEYVKRDTYDTPHWQNWNLLEFDPNDVKVAGFKESFHKKGGQYSRELSDSGGKQFAEIFNSAQSKKEFIERLFATFSVRIPNDFNPEGTTYGKDGKPTLIFSEAAMIKAEKEAQDARIAGLAKNTESALKETARDMTAADHWEVEKDREEAAKKTRTPIATEAPESAKTKAQLDAEGKVEGAKRYGASGVRFNIGGPKNPDSFGGEIRGEKGVKVESTPANWNEKDLKLIQDYLSADAAVLRNMGYPKFYFNSHITGEDSNWISAPVPAANGNFLVYELNPKGSGASGNSYRRTVRLFRKLVNSDGKQIGSMTEVGKNELVGMSTISLAADGKPLFQVPAVFHAMMKAAQDSLASRQMSEEQVNYSGDITNPNPLNARIPLSGTVHEDMTVFEENEMTPPGLRDKMEVFNGLKNGSAINSAIVGFIGNPDNAAASVLSSQLQSNALWAAQDAEQFIQGLAAQLGLEPGTYALVTSPHDDELYPIIKRQGIYPTEARLMLKWIQNGYERIIYEVGKHDPDTGLELPDKVQAMLNGVPRWLPKPGPNGEKMPMLVSNPLKWKAVQNQWMTAEDFTLRDAEGKITFQPKPHQVVGPNAAMTRWFPPGVESAPRDLAAGQPRAILINDAPGTGKTLQMLMAAVLYRKQLMKLSKDPTSKWFGMKIQPVLIITQNAQIIQNAFKGDATMAGIDLNGTFTENGFEPNEYEDTPNGRILTGNSWIDIGTYSSIKPTQEKVLLFEADGKTPKMVEMIIRNEAGKAVPGPDGKPQTAYHPTEVDARGMPVPLTEQAFRMVTIGPPKKGSGKWGVIMFDESHNMKNDTSARSDAGFEIMSKAQHVLLASGTPIDKPTQLGPILGMLLDKPLEEIATQLGMRLAITKRSEDLLLKKRLPEDGAPIMEKAKLEYGTMPSDPIEREKAYNNLFIKLRALRDEAGKAGAILRRSTKYFGVDNIWLDPTDSFHEDGQKALLDLQTWWFEEMAAAAEGGGATGLSARNLKGMLLFESKRLTSLIKCGIPNTPWNPSSEPRGAAKIMLDELKEGRKVIITMDTSNPFNLEDTQNIRRFRGLKTTEDAPLPYESEWVQWKKYLDSLGIKFGSITGDFGIAEREHTVREFQKNNPDLSVIIMTTMSGGTGLSIDDRHGVGGKTNPKKQYTDAEIATMKQVGAEEIEGQKINSGSLPRTMIIVSSPWGGDVFIQAMGRTDRVLSTTPSRIIVLTSNISEGDEKLAELVRMKTMATNAINETGDELAAAVIMDAAENGAGLKDAEGLKPVKEMGGVTASEKSGASISEEVKYFKNKASQTIRKHITTVGDVIKTNKLKINDRDKNGSSNRDVTRWDRTVELAEAYQNWMKEVKAGLEKGTHDYKDIISNPEKYTFEQYKKRMDEDYVIDVESEDGLIDGNQLALDLPFGNPIPGRQGVPTSVGALSKKGKPSRNRQIIDKLYGVHHLASGGRVTPEHLAAIEKTIVDIVSPMVEFNKEGRLSDQKLKSIMRMASDVAHLIHRYEMIIKKVGTNVDYGGQMSFAGRAILLLVKNGRAPNAGHLYHEIGHTLFEIMPEAEKQAILAELEAARKSWQHELGNEHPLDSFVFPATDWRFPEGTENFDLVPKGVKKPPVPYARSLAYNEVGRVRTPGGLLANAANYKNDRIGASLASRAMEIAFANALMVGWAKPGSMPNFAKSNPVTEYLFGQKGQANIVAKGKTPQQKAIKALLSVFASVMIKETEAVNKRMKSLVKHGTGKDLTTGATSSKVEITLNDIHKLAKSGWGHYSVGEDGSLTITTRAQLLTNAGRNGAGILDYDGRKEANYAEDLARPNLLEIKVSGKDVYEMFVDSFGAMSSASESILSVFRNPAADDFDFISMANTASEVVTGKARAFIVSHNYKYINLDEWLANNAEHLFNDFYSRNEHSDLAGLTASITSSIFVNACAGGFGEVAKSIVARLVSGQLAPEFKEPALKLSATQWMAQAVKDRNKIASNTAANAPPDAEIDDNALSIDPTPIIGPARRKLEAATEGLNALASALAQSTLDSRLIEDGSKMSEWLKSVRSRKFKTGTPDNITGFGVGYKLEHIWGTLIGQVEQIAFITGDPYVAELSKRLYPSPNTGLNVRTTYTEDVYAHTAFWNNRFDSIIRNNLQRKINEAKNDKVRRLVNGAENMPGFVDAMAHYILKVHNPIYNTLERLQFEIDAIKEDDKGNKRMTASIKRELKTLGLSADEWKKVKVMMESERRDAVSEASRFNKGSSYDKVVLGRESDWVLGEFIEAGGIDKMMMDVGRAQSIPQDAPEHLTRSSRFEPEVLAAADELSTRWSSEYMDWAKRQGAQISDWGTSWVPRMIDGNIVSSYGNAAGDDFILTAAKAYLEDNKFQRVRLPSTLKAPLMDFSVSSLIVNSDTLPHLSRSEVLGLLAQFRDPVTDVDTLTYPSWMQSRAAQVLGGKKPKEAFMGYDVSCRDLVDGKEVEDIDEVTGAATPRTEKTTIAQHLSVNLQIYLAKLEQQAIAAYGNPKKAMTIKSYRDEYEMITTAIAELAESHQRKVLDGPLTEKDAIAIAKKWRQRIDHRSSGVSSSNEGYADLFGGQHGNMKRPNSLMRRMMDTAAADRILERFYIRDPRVYGPAYNESVTRNIMLKKHIPEAFFEAMQKSITSNFENRRFWPELAYMMSKITNTNPTHDSSTLFKSVVSLASATTFMPVTSVLQLTESMPAGLHAPSNPSSSNFFIRLLGSTTPGVAATGNTLRIATLKSANAVIKSLVELGTLHSVYVPPEMLELEVDSFMYRLAERSGVIMSSMIEDMPKSSADPRGTFQRFTDKMINRYHRQGNALATVTDMSRVAVLKGNVLMLESTADEILLRELSRFGNNGAPDEVEFAKLLKPLEILLFRNLGIPDSDLKGFLNHALITRSITQQDISKIPRYKIEQTLRTLIDSGYEEGNIYSQQYSNALNRLNMLTIQRSVPANMSRLRGLVDRHVGVFAGSFMFFLTNFNSALARNVILPSQRLLTRPYSEPRTVRSAGDQERNRPQGTYLTNVGYPVSPEMSTTKMLPAIALMAAATTFINYETRQIRMKLRADPAATFMDDRTTLMKVFAAIDQAGFTGNLSLPINVAQALRYQREAAQVAAGPFFGGIAGVVDAARTVLSDKNSANTPTAERAFAKIAYDMIIRPIGQVGLQMLTSSGGIGDILNLAGTQAMALPQTRESFMRWVADDIFAAGNGGKRVPVSRADLVRAYENNLITREEFMTGLEIRAQYDSQHKKEMATRKADEDFKARTK